MTHNQLHQNLQTALQTFYAASNRRRDAYIAVESCPFANSKRYMELNEAYEIAVDGFDAAFKAVTKARDADLAAATQVIADFHARHAEPHDQRHLDACSGKLAREASAKAL
jgi:hypothetical protein